MGVGDVPRPPGSARGRTPASSSSGPFSPESPSQLQVPEQGSLRYLTSDTCRECHHRPPLPGAAPRGWSELGQSPAPRAPSRPPSPAKQSSSEASQWALRSPLGCPPLGGVRVPAAGPRGGVCVEAAGPGRGRLAWNGPRQHCPWGCRAPGLSPSTLLGGERCHWEGRTPRGHGHTLDTSHPGEGLCANLGVGCRDHALYSEAAPPPAPPQPTPQAPPFSWFRQRLPLPWGLKLLRHVGRASDRRGNTRQQPRGCLA